MNPVHLLKTQRFSLNEIIAQTRQERGIEPMALEAELLLKRVQDGGHSGQFLGDAFLSAYRGDTFNRSLKELLKLDAEAFRLFHEILHIRHVKGWYDDSLHEIEKQVKEMLASEY